jgi:hypothetical protein
MFEIITLPVLCIGITFVLAIIALRIKDWWFEPSPELVTLALQKSLHRLQTPDFAAVERHFGHPLPECLLALHADKQELMRSDFFVARTEDDADNECWEIAYYQPVDERSVRNPSPGREGYFAFAIDGIGNDYLIDPKEDDPAVLFRDDVTGEVTGVCDRFTEFMKWPRFRS